MGEGRPNAAAGRAAGGRRLAPFTALVCLALALPSAAQRLPAPPPDAAVADILAAGAALGRTLPPAAALRLAQTPDDFGLQGGWRLRATEARSHGAPVTGSFPLLVVPATFADSRAPSVTREDLQRILFDGPAEAGTLTEFYEVSSRGLFTVRGEVAPWVQTGLTVAEVQGASYGLGNDARTGEFLLEALRLADDWVDFTAFDNDGPDGIPNSGDDDGVVDALAVEFLEAPSTCLGAGPTIWGHRSRIESWGRGRFVSEDLGISGEPIQASDYIVQPAERCDGRPQDAVVIAHEFGHALGLPDLYDQTEGILASQRNWVVGCWSIMAAGQWGCGPALDAGRWDRPPHFGPWEKEWLGWLPDARSAPDSLEAIVVLDPVETTGQVLRVDLSPTEYLLIEYRDGSGFDVNLPGTGILLHHVDQTRITGARRCRGCPQLYLAALLEADANASLLLPEGEGGSRGEAGDVFAEGAVHRVTNATRPSTRLNSGAPTDVAIHSMTVTEGRARLTLSTRTVDLDALLAPFFGDGPGPTPAERAHLDRWGNADGRFDLGDLARYLAEHPVVVAKAGGGP